MAKRSLSRELLFHDVKLNRSEKEVALHFKADGCASTLNVARGGGGLMMMMRSRLNSPFHCEAQNGTQSASSFSALTINGCDETEKLSTFSLQRVISEQPSVVLVRLEGWRGNPRTRQLWSCASTVDECNSLHRHQLVQINLIPFTHFPSKKLLCSASSSSIHPLTARCWGNGNVSSSSSLLTEAGWRGNKERWLNVGQQFNRVGLTTLLAPPRRYRPAIYIANEILLFTLSASSFTLHD